MNMMSRISQKNRKKEKEIIPVITKEAIPPLAHGITIWYISHGTHTEGAYLVYRYSRFHCSSLVLIRVHVLKVHVGVEHVRYWA